MEEAIPENIDELQKAQMLEARERARQRKAEEEARLERERKAAAARKLAALEAKVSYVLCL